MPLKNIREVKTGLRARFRALREAMSRETKLKMDSDIQCRLLTLREYRAEDTVFTYVSKEIEVDTIAVIKAALLNKKRVAVPRCIPGTREMAFYYIRSLGDLEKGSFGVLEPIPARCEAVTDFSHGFCIVPGLGFDAQGFRLGYGKGYYDRFLSQYGGFTVGICYSSCVQWQLPHGYYDRPVDLLITEKYVRRTAARAK